MPSTTNRWSNLPLHFVSECLTHAHSDTPTQHTRIRKARWCRSQTPFGKATRLCFISFHLECLYIGG